MIPMALRHARFQFKWLVTNRENVSAGSENTITRLTLAVQICNDAIADVQRTNGAILEELRRRGPEESQVTGVATTQEDGTFTEAQNQFLNGITMKGGNFLN